MATAPRNRISFDELGLGSLLKRYRLRVPPNQREYAWEELEVGDLLKDYALAVNAKRTHFLGAIVTIPQEDDAGALEIVDGQQRLATTAILLAAIRDYATELDDKMLVESIQNDYLSTIDLGRREYVPRLTLNVDDNELFSHIMKGVAEESRPAASLVSHHLLLEALAKAREQVETIAAPFDRRERGGVLAQWVEFIEHGAYAVLLQVPSERDAFRMFETLNDRGLETSEADLIKNHLFREAKARLPEAQNHWTHMRGALESTSEDSNITIDFVRHGLITQRGHMREADLYDEVREVVKSEQTAVSLSATFEALANIYVATFSGDHERWNPYPETARRAIRALNLIDMKPMRPLLLAVGAKMDQKEGTKALRLLLSLGVRLIIASNPRSRAVEEPLANTAKRVYGGDVTTAKELAEALSNITPGDARFTEAFEIARVSKASLARYFLRSLEQTAKGDPAPSFVPEDDTQHINLDHVLPRTPKDNWPQFEKDEAQRLYTRLGNVALLQATSNSSLRSSSFHDKKPIYAKSAFELTSQIAEADTWDAEAINDRQKVLAKLAPETWPLAT
jgi:Protein of unknown function DUF262/Protein of unknown function (DUF1524)